VGHWDDLDLPTLNGADINIPFSTMELHDTTMHSLAEKALGPDGFTDVFYRRCWSIIKHDVMVAFHHLHRLAGGNFPALKA
jgi:hypothetical protein